jgi:hypothetical protein
MKGCYLPQIGHIVNITPPVDINGGIVYSDVFSMKDAAHVDIIIQMGVNAASTTMTVEECSNFTPSASTAIAFNYQLESTALGDTLAAKVLAPTTGLALGTTDNVFLVVSIDAAQLTDGYPDLRVVFSNPAASNILSAVAILTGLRYQKELTATEIA